MRRELHVAQSLVFTSFEELKVMGEDPVEEHFDSAPRAEVVLDAVRADPSDEVAVQVDSVPIETV